MIDITQIPEFDLNIILSEYEKEKVFITYNIRKNIEEKKEGVSNTQVFQDLEESGIYNGINMTFLSFERIKALYYLSKRAEIKKLKE